MQLATILFDLLAWGSLRFIPIVAIASHFPLTHSTYAAKLSTKYPTSDEGI